MSPAEFVIQFLDGLALASSLFLVASGLSIIFGVTRVVNFAHGSFYMLGAYLAYSLVERLSDPAGYWGGLVLAALLVGLVGAAMEVVVLKRIYRSPELFQLLATFGVVLVIADTVLFVWGPEDLLGPRAPGLKGVVRLFGATYPAYQLFLIVLGPAVMGLLWLVFHRTRWGVLVRAATQDREMVSALGVNQAWLFTGVFFLGAFLAGLAGALELPQSTVHHRMDLEIIVETFVVVVVGGMGSILGAFLAAVLIGELHAFGILLFPQITLVLVFLVMAVVLVIRPWGLLGRAEAAARTPAMTVTSAALGGERRMAAAGLAVLAVLAVFPWVAGDYAVYVMSELLIFALYAASLHFILGGGGMISFGHAAYFGLGSYGAALAVKWLAAPMGAAMPLGVALAAAGALVYGFFCVRLSGIYMAMLTLAFAQITYAVAFQWYGFTGGDNGILGVWPEGWTDTRTGFYYLSLGLAALGVLVLRHALGAPFGYALRAAGDSPVRSASLGLDIRRQQWLGFAFAGVFAGLAGALYAYFKGSVFPDNLAIATSLEGLVMVLLGGVQTLSGPVVGGVLYKALQIVMTARTDYWQLILGLAIVGLVLAFPQGVVGYARVLRERWAGGRP